MLAAAHTSHQLTVICVFWRFQRTHRCKASRSAYRAPCTLLQACWLCDGRLTVGCQAGPGLSALKPPGMIWVEASRKLRSRCQSSVSKLDPPSSIWEYFDYERWIRKKVITRNKRNFVEYYKTFIFCILKQLKLRFQFFNLSKAPLLTQISP